MQKLGDYIKEYSARNKQNEDIPVYSVTNSNGFCRDYFGKEVASSNKKTYKIVPRNAFAYNPSRINVGSVDYQHYEDRVIVSPLYNVFTVDERVVPEYLYFYLKSPNTIKRIKTVASGSVRDNLKLSMLNEFPISLPSVSDQKAIVKTMNKVQAAIDSKKSALEKLDNLIKARFVELFGDPNVEFNFPVGKFKEYAKDMTKGPFGSDMKKDLFVPKGEDTYKVYIQANAIQGDQNIGDYYISKEYFNSKIFKFEVKPGDYIITCDGTLGKHLKLNEKMERGVISPSLLRITLDENKMTKEYFEGIWDMYMLLLMKKEARNACLIHLPSAKVIGEIDIPIPPFELQKEFSLFVNQVDKSKFAVQKSLEKTQQLFDSLMQEYFG